LARWLIVTQIQLTPFSDVADGVKFFRGQRFRKYQVGMMQVEEADDYYEYMLVDNGDPYMLLINPSSAAGIHKVGAVVCYVQKLASSNRAVVPAAAMKYSMGLKNMFVIDLSQV
jgi:hypothetical protein